MARKASYKRGWLIVRLRRLIARFSDRNETTRFIIENIKIPERTLRLWSSKSEIVNAGVCYRQDGHVYWNKSRLLLLVIYLVSLNRRHYDDVPTKEEAREQLGLPEGYRLIFSSEETTERYGEDEPEGESELDVE